MKRIDFIIALEGIMEKNAPNLPMPSTSGGRPARLNARTSRLIGRHFPNYCPPAQNRERPVRNCAQCRKEDKRKGTSVCHIHGDILFVKMVYCLSQRTFQYLH